MLLTMAEPLGEVCSVARRLLRRGLGLQTSRHVNVFFPAIGRILFEQAAYDRSYDCIQKEVRLFGNRICAATVISPCFVTKLNSSSHDRELCQFKNF